MTDNKQTSERQILFLGVPDSLVKIKEKGQSLVEEKVLVIKRFNVEVKSVDEKNYSLKAVVSTPQEDRHGDTINPAGWSLKNYMDNPVLLWGHDHRKPAIGKATAVTMNADGELICDFVFDKDDADAVLIYKKYVKSILNTFSVGFLIKKLGTQITENDPSGYTFDEQELIEVSAVNVPANPGSHVMRDFVKSINKDECSILNKCNEKDENEPKEGVEKKQEKETKPEVNEQTELKEQVKALASTVKEVLQLLKATKSQHGKPDQATSNADKSKSESETLTISLTQDEVKQLKSNAQIVDKSNELNLRIVNAAIKKTAQVTK